MYGWPAVRKGLLEHFRGRLLAVMCPASCAAGTDRRPGWVPRMGTSTNPRARDPSLLQACPNPPVQPTTPSLSFPRKLRVAARTCAAAAGW
jgi:hypothetical protein